MKKLYVVLMTILLSTVLFAQKTINDPNVEDRKLSGFHVIRLSHSITVYITQGNEDAVAVSASNAEFRNKIKTKVENGALIISVDNEKKFWKGLSGDKQKLRAYISVKKLDMLYVSGACNVYIEDGMSADKLMVNLSGASDLKAKIDTKELTVDMSGASTATITGNTAKLAIEASGACDFKGFDLMSNFCDAVASGASSVSITVNKELSANASGASSVKFKGEGLIRDIKTSGASNVSRKS